LYRNRGLLMAEVTLDADAVEAFLAVLSDWDHDFSK
jgi:hypothetical protein